jgi:hypothetical protein
MSPKETDPLNPPQDEIENMTGEERKIKIDEFRKACIN